MADSFEVKGADQLARLAKQLREAGDKGLQRELGKAINRAVKPVKADLKKSAADNLPKKGGFADAIAASKFRTRRRTSAKNPGLKVVAQNKFSLWHPDHGQIRHRIKGKPPALWTIQKIRPGWWTDVTRTAAPEVRKEISQAMDDIAKKIYA